MTQGGFNVYFSEHLCMASSHVIKSKNLKNHLLTLRNIFKKKLWNSTNNCCYCLTSNNVYTVRKCAVGDSVPTLTKSKKRGFELKLIESIF